MKLEDLTPEQLATLTKNLAAKQQAEQETRQNEIATYKTLAHQAVDECFPILVDNATQLKYSKEHINSEFSAIIASKGELYGIKEGQQSHQFTNKDNTRRIQIGYNTLDKYDDTAEAGIAIVREYVESLGSTPETRQLVNIILDLLAKDSKGTLNAQRVLKLRKFANESGNKRFIEGVRVIMDAYKPEFSRMYIKASQRTPEGAWVNIPGSITEC